MVLLQLKNSKANNRAILSPLGKFGRVLINYFLASTGKSQPQLKIEALVENLRKIPDVEDVIKENRTPSNLNELTFKLIVNNADFNKIREIEEKAIDLVIDTEWNLCDLCNSEDWHFSTQVINNHSLNYTEK